ncbi:MAG: ArsR family transcriptional regulator [Nitrospirae bacterium]|nr:ArsR family transcriptional regulator [Nitrospirota bacterium]
MVKKQKPKEPFVPAERHETIRKDILSLLLERTLSAKEISAEVHISEKDVYEHLEHIGRSTHKTGHHLTVIPAECSKCGFVFIKRERLKKPGRCPICHGEKIQEPLFVIREAEI